MQAPIETVDCTNTPATIGVLGVSIDVSSANFSPRGHGKVTECADLVVGQSVEVALTRRPQRHNRAVHRSRGRGGREK